MTAPWAKPISARVIEATKSKLHQLDWVAWDGSGEVVWLDQQNDGTLWVEIVGGVETLVAGDATGMRCLEIPTAMLRNFVRMERASLADLEGDS